MGYQGKKRGNVDVRCDQTDRRQFLARCAQSLAGVTIVGFVAPQMQGCSDSATDPNTSPEMITVDVSSLDADGKGLKTAMKGPDNRPVLVIRQSATVYVAMTTKCAHQGCEVGLPISGTITCPCHGSQYDLNGNRTGGPAQSGLPMYQATFNPSDATVTVTLS